MTPCTYRKGRFYELPIQDIRNEGSNSFFIVNANGKEYAIRMFDFQRNDPTVRERTMLPCMVKDVHGGNIVFVQNFARMLGGIYAAGKRYPFVVKSEVESPVPDTRYYDVKDEHGVPFRVKCTRDVLLVPNQKVYCTVTRPAADRLVLTLNQDKGQPAQHCISPEELLLQAGIEGAASRFFAHDEAQAEARACCRQGNAEWVVKAVLAVSKVDGWTRLGDRNRERMLSVYYHICLYLLEDSDYLLQFSESDRENYQQWIAERVSQAETYLQCLEFMRRGRSGEETDTILRKIRQSGYIYHPHRRMELLIAMFSMQPELLEEKIDPILDLVQECAKKWRQPSFYDAFSSFLRFYITSNRERANRLAVADDPQSRSLLGRMVRSICFLLIMTDGQEPNAQLYRSMLLHYLSFMRSRTILEGDTSKRSLSERLVEQAFATLLLSREETLDLTWSRDFGSTEILAYQMASAKTLNTTFLTRSYEACNVRFTVSAEGITLSRSLSDDKEKNVLPANVPGWHNLQVFLNSPAKYNISGQTRSMRQWRAFWNNVEQGLFESRESATKKQIKKIAPEVGTETYVRVLWKDDTHPCRFYCRIEDMLYEGGGWIDTYQKGEPWVCSTTSLISPWRTSTKMADP